jgi:predicted transcriptional regulator of viral defense system
MLFSYAAGLEKFGTNYKLKIAMNEGKLFQIEKGIYSDIRAVPELEIIGFKYPRAIFTLDSAFYYYGLTDTIPDLYVVNTDRNATKINDKRIKQCFCREEILDIGKMQMNYQGTKIQIYDMERMVIELVRHRTKLPYDYYKEIVRSFRGRIQDMDIEKLQSYIPLFPVNNKIQGIIEEEIF